MQPTASVTSLTINGFKLAKSIAGFPIEVHMAGRAP